VNDPTQGDRFSRFLLTVVAGALVVGVAGLWAMNASVARLEERVSNWTQIYEDRFERMDGRMQRIEDKVDGR